MKIFFNFFLGFERHLGFFPVLAIGRYSVYFIQEESIRGKHLSNGRRTVRSMERFVWCLECVFTININIFQLDNIIETNNATIETLEGVMKKLSSMSPDDAKSFQLDDTLGSRSRTLHQRAIKRYKGNVKVSSIFSNLKFLFSLYGDKTRDVIDGLMKNPSVVVPIVLER